MRLALTEHGSSIWLPLRVQPRASKNEVLGVSPSGALRVRIKAPPVDGAANKALLRWLSKRVLKLSPTTLSLVKGQTGRDKVVSVTGLTLAEVAERLQPWLP